LAELDAGSARIGCDCLPECDETHWPNVMRPAVGIDENAQGQLWFILYLFVMVIISLPFMILYNQHSKNVLLGKTPLIVLILFGIIPVFAHPLLNIGGKSLCEYLAYFLLGYFVLSNENVLQKLDDYRFFLLGIAVVSSGVSCYFDNAFFEAASWLSVLAILGLARHSLNFSNKYTDYLSKFSFGVFIFHQSWIVIAAFFIFGLTGKPALQIPAIMLSAIILTYLSYEICKRIPPLRWMFGLKK
jgi:surface polysaccharide O-acyltransferase-like enzyme